MLRSVAEDAEGVPVPLKLVPDEPDNSKWPRGAGPDSVTDQVSVSPTSGTTVSTSLSTSCNVAIGVSTLRVRAGM